ncbi:hypothetical protein GIY62_21990 [Burkholderia plantarii]|uniref:hypothetical protein n=1 Tax=Burkholderia plantarii TaxID=41899 RepID=UPI00272B1E03|nr:hypothetical protein [Burkholderia plantarii]WLE63028.1 hypothetical protein GIY62_21990 [Burkholderia plantarii]
MSAAAAFKPLRPSIDKPGDQPTKIKTRHFVIGCNIQTNLADPITASGLLSIMVRRIEKLR